jgi:hypothetical protein
MRITACLAAFMWVMTMFGGPIACAAKIDYDSGIIEVITESDVTIKGQKGEHVLELMRDCAWCEVGMEVLVTFSGYTRASIKPYVDNDNSRSVPTFITKDGRDEGGE